MSRNRIRRGPAPSAPAPAPARTAVRVPIALRALAEHRANGYATIAGGLGATLAQRGLAAPDERTAIALDFTPPARWQRERDRRVVGLVTPETDELPPHDIGPLHLVESVIVPSTWAAEVISTATSRPVHQIALGIDPHFFAPERRTRGERLRILFLASHADDVRKGADVAMRAFLAAFPGRTDVELIVRSSFPARIDKSDPRIAMRSGVLASDDLRNLYLSADVLLAPSRAEAFGFIPLEAMATGLPVIYTGETGCRDYGDLGLPVSGRRVPARGRFGYWIDPSIGEIVDRLREVDRDFDGAAGRAFVDADAIAARYTWDRALDALLDHLG